MRRWLDRRRSYPRPRWDRGAHLGIESLEVRTLLSAVPGDFNSDARVDAADIPVWQSGYGVLYDGMDFLNWQRNVGYEAPSATVLIGAGVKNGGLTSTSANASANPWLRTVVSGAAPDPGLKVENNRGGADGGDWLLQTSDGSGSSPAHNIFYSQSFPPPAGPGRYDVDLSGFTKASASWWSGENWNWIQEARIELWIDGQKVWEGGSANNSVQRDQWVVQTHSGQYQVSSSIAVRLRSIKGNDNFGNGSFGAIYAVSRWDDIRLEASFVSETPEDPTYPAGTTLRTTSALNLRSSPQVIAGNILGVLPVGATLTVVADGQGVTEQLPWVRVQGMLNGTQVTGWVHADYVEVINEVDDAGRFINSVTGQPHNFIGGNYTDLGLVGAGYRSFSAAQAAADLDRLASVGATHVRIWATDLPEGGLINVDDAPGRQAAAERVGVIATLAAARGMDVTVDLWSPGQGVLLYQSLEAKFNNLVDVIVAGNAHHDNIIWSPGNEIQDPDNPAAFAAWFTQKAARIRQVAGPGTRISAELTPGAVNHPWASAAYVAAAQSIVAATDVVAIHFYPTLLPAEAEANNTDWDWRSIKLWIQYAQAAGKPFILGEFGMNVSVRTGNAYQLWLQKFESLGVQNVSLWQFMKVGVGHLDPFSHDLVLPGQDISGFLAANGWLFRAPPPV